MKVIDYLSSQLEQLGVPQVFYVKIINECIKQMENGKRKAYFNSKHGDIHYKFKILFKVRKEQEIIKHKIDIYEVDTTKSIIGV